MNYNFQKIQTFNLSVEQLQLSEDKIIRGMGYSGIDSPDYLKPLVYRFMSEVKNHSTITCGFEIFESAQLKISKRNIVCNDIEFQVDPLIGIHLNGATKLVIFTVTIGEIFDKWVEESSTLGNHLDSFVIDTIGAELVECAADWLENEIYKQVHKYQLYTSNRLSPGYCNWNVKDQHKLFSLLPKNFCGISLNDSAMMSPRKSISGIIGIGENVKRLDYQCNICDLENCYKRR